MTLGPMVGAGGSMRLLKSMSYHSHQSDVVMHHKNTLLANLDVYLLALVLFQYNTKVDFWMPLNVRIRIFVACSHFA